jgi:hypothetical protein
MKETFRLSDYQIRIGKEDIIEQHLHDIFGQIIAAIHTKNILN